MEKKKIVMEIVTTNVVACLLSIYILNNTQTNILSLHVNLLYKYSMNIGHKLSKYCSNFAPILSKYCRPTLLFTASKSEVNTLDSQKVEQTLMYSEGVGHTDQLSFLQHLIAT